MLRTAPLTRALLSAAAATTAAFGLIAVPARAAHAERCPGALDVPATREELSTASDAVVCLVNAERADRDLRPLRRDSDLGQAGRRHAADMARRKYFSHVTPNGRGVGDRARDAGYFDPGDVWKVGENLGWGTGGRATPDSLVDHWLDSPRHRRLLLEESYRELGVGVAAGAPKPTTSGLPGATYALELGVIH